MTKRKDLSYIFNEEIQDTFYVNDKHNMQEILPLKLQYELFLINFSRV